MMASFMVILQNIVDVPFKVFSFFINYILNFICFGNCKSTSAWCYLSLGEVAKK